MRSLHPWPLFPSHLTPSAARSLSLQFLIQELLFAFDYLESLETSLREEKSTIKIEEIFERLNQWLLFSLEKPLSQKGGSIDNLCFYSEIVLKNSTVEEADIPMILESLRLTAFRMKSKVRSYSSTHLQNLIDPLMALVEESRSILKQFFSILTPFLEESHEDENILFCLIEQKERLNRHLGDRSIEKILSQLFPNGPRALRAALYDGYARRGFLDFFNKNREKIDSLDWEATPCNRQK